MDLDLVSVHKNAKRELGQYPAILTSRLVNNIYMYRKKLCLSPFLFFLLTPLKLYNMKGFQALELKKK